MHEGALNNERVHEDSWLQHLDDCDNSLIFAKRM